MPQPTCVCPPGRRRRAAVLASTLALGLVLPGAPLPWPTPAAAQTQPVAAVQSNLYFGLSSADGAGVSEQQWETFLREVITPRFPDGLTVISVYGQTGTTTQQGILEERTKLLVLVHPDTPEAAASLEDIKRVYTARFNQTAVFHTRTAVEIVPPAQATR